MYAAFRRLGRLWKIAIPVCLALAVVFVAALVSAELRHRTSPGADVSGSDSVATTAAGRDVADALQLKTQEESATATTAAGSTAPAGSSTAAASSAAEGSSAADGQETFAASLSGTQLTLGQKVISTATLQIEVGSGKFQAAFDQATLLADKYGGYVVSSDSSAPQDEGVARSGTAAIRVPQRSLSQALSDAAGLGKVKSRQVQSQDVTEQYVDLKARLTNAQAQEKSLLALMDRAKTIDETLRVRQVLSSTQEEIEQIKGRLNYLEEHTSFATITISIFEPGVAVATTGGGWGFTAAVGDALHRLVATVNGLVVFVGGALPVMVVLALLGVGGYAAVRSARRRRNRQLAAGAGGGGNSPEL